MKLFDHEKGAPLPPIEEIVRVYYEDIFSFLCRKMPSFQDAEDVTQIVFLKFAKGMEKYHEQGKLKNYLFKMAINASHDFYRKKVDFAPIDEGMEQPSKDPCPIDVVIEKERGLRIRRALLCLPEFQRDTIILRFYQDLAFRDIARITNTNVSTAKSRYKQGLKKLSAMIKSGGLEDE